MNVLRKYSFSLKNSVFCRHSLATRRLQTNENVDQYLESLKKLANGDDFQAVTSTQVRDEYIRDAFINRISANHIRQRLLENRTLDLQTAYNQTLTLEMAPKTISVLHSIGLSNCFFIYCLDWRNRWRSVWERWVTYCGHPLRTEMFLLRKSETL